MTKDGADVTGYILASNVLLIVCPRKMVFFLRW